MGQIKLIYQTIILLSCAYRELRISFLVSNMNMRDCMRRNAANQPIEFNVGGYGMIDNDNQFHLARLVPVLTRLVLVSCFSSSPTVIFNVSYCKEYVIVINLIRKS